MYCKRCGCERGEGGGVRRAATAQVQVVVGGVVRGGRSANLHRRDEETKGSRGAVGWSWRERVPADGRSGPDASVSKFCAPHMPRDVVDVMDG